MTQTLAHKPFGPPSRSPQTGAARSGEHAASGGAARGIALGAALSAPMWVGIVYLVRELVGVL